MSRIIWGLFAAVVLVGTGWLAAYQPVIAVALGVGSIALYAAVVRPKAARDILVGLALAFSAGAGVSLAGEDAGVGYAAVRAAVVVLAVVLALVFLRGVMYALGREKSLMALILLGLVSLMYADGESQPSMLLGIASAVLVGACLGSLYSRERAAQIVLRVAVITSLVSLGLIFFIPEVGTIRTVRPGGEIISMPIGLFAWNSELGFMAAVGAVLAFAFWAAFRKVLHMLLMAVMLGVTVLSGSATALLAAAAGIAAVIWVGGRRATRFAVTAAAVLVAVFWATGGLAVFMDQVLGLLGRSSDLTGRTVIWPVALGFAEKHPFFGYGIGAPPSIGDVLGFEAGHAHNGYIDLLLNLGGVGLAVFAVGAVAALVRAFRWRDPILGGILAVFLVSNMANNFLVSAHLALMLYAWAVFSRKPTQSVTPPQKWKVSPTMPMRFTELKLSEQRHQ